MAFVLPAKSTVVGGRAFRAARPQATITVSRNLRGLSLIALSVDKAAVLEDVRGVIAEQLGIKVDTIAPESKFVDLGADSLDTVEIMMAFEEKFALTLDEEGAEKISTVKEAADMLAAQITEKSS